MSCQSQPRDRTLRRLQNAQHGGSAPFIEFRLRRTASFYRKRSRIVIRNRWSLRALYRRLNLQVLVAVESLFSDSAKAGDGVGRESGAAARERPAAPLQNECCRGRSAWRWRYGHSARRPSNRAAFELDERIGLKSPAEYENHFESPARNFSNGSQ